MKSIVEKINKMKKKLGGDDCCEILVGIEERIKHLESEIRKYKYDDLTGFKRKVDFDADFKKKFEEYSMNNKEFYLIVIDINYLHNINKLEGWEKGNKLIIDVANKIKSIFGEEKVYRIGGDEFCVLIDKEDMKKINLEELVDDRFIKAFVWNKNYLSSREMFKEADKILNQKKLKRNNKRV